MSSPEPGTSHHLVVAIDGPAASGKSSTARWVAERLGFHHVDSGSLYRAATAAILRTGSPSSSWTPEGVIAAAEPVTLEPEGVTFAVRLHGEPIDAELRGTAVTESVSTVAQMSLVRAWVNARVREAAVGCDIVVDGRDMGTAVFPEADLKVYLVADPWERARRRLVQRLHRTPADSEVAAETEQIVRRDAADATQSLQARDAVLVDTTYLTQQEQVERIVALVRAVTQRGKESSAVEKADQGG